MSRILADAKPAPPRVGCVLLRCRLGARGRDGASLPLTEEQRRALVQELTVFAGPVADRSPESGVFFVDPSSLARTVGGVDAWARCVKGYLNARGYSASVGVAGDEASALAAARSRWGVAVVHRSQPPPPPTRPASSHRDRAGETTAVGLIAPSLPSLPGRRAAGPSGSSSATRGGARPASAQLGLPGLVLGRPKRPRRPKTAAA